MRICLLFLSLLLTGFAGFGQQNAADVDPVVRRYLFNVALPKASLSGVMMIGERDDCIIGSLVNEFGVSAANFVYNKKNGKLKLIDVISFLNKWYIKRVLSNDIKLIVRTMYGIPHSVGKNYEVKNDPGNLKVINKKRNIIYDFSVMPACEMPADTTIKE